MHLGLIDWPFVPHNLSSAQDSPVPLPKFQMASRFKILMSSGSKKGNQIYCPFTQKVPASESPPGSPTGPLCLQGIFTSLLIYLFLSFVRVPAKRAPSMFPDRVPMDRDTPSPEPFHSFMYSYICRSPQKGALHMEKNHKVTVHGALHRRRPTYNGVRTGSPRGLLTTLLSLPQCHAAFGTISSTLAWVDQSPVSQCMS